MSDNDSNSVRVSVSMDDLGRGPDTSSIGPDNVHTGGLHSGGMGNAGQHDEHGSVRVQANPHSPSFGNFKVRDGAGITSRDQIKGSDIVVLSNGFETRYEVAVAEGLIDPNAMPGQTQPQQQNDQQQQDEQRGDLSDPEASNVPLDDVSETLLRNAFQNAGDSAYDAALSMMDTGVPSDAAIEAFASNLSIEPQEARAQIEHVAQAYTKQAYDAVVKSTGLSADLVAQALTQAREGGDTNLRQAMEQFFVTGRVPVKAFSEIARNAVATLDMDADNRTVLMQRRFNGATMVDNGDHILVRFTNGPTMRFADAVRTGRLKV